MWGPAPCAARAKVVNAHPHPHPLQSDSCWSPQHPHCLIQSHPCPAQNLLDKVHFTLRLDDQPKTDVLDVHEAEAEEPEAGKSEAEDDEDEVDDLPSSRRPWRGPISRKASQTSVYLQEWDIPFEQVELGEPIGQGRWGRVHRGRWHGEVAIRLLEMDGHNQDHLKLFKKEVMNYRQTRHENVVLFMGACMNPPHLAIITR